MGDFAKQFVDVHGRALEQPDFNPRRATWRIDMSSWSSVVKSRFGAMCTVFGMPGDMKLMDIPVALVATRDLPEYLDMDISPSSTPARDPTLICLAYEGKYGFARYVISAASDAAFHEFDTTGGLTGAAHVSDGGDTSPTSTNGGGK